MRSKIGRVVADKGAVGTLERFLVAVDPHVSTEVHFGTKHFGALVAVEGGLAVHVLDVVVEPAQIDELFVAFGTGVVLLFLVNLHVLFHRFGPT